MTGSEWAQVIAALLSGSMVPLIIGFLWRRLRRDPKADAETRKLNADADDRIAARLYREIDRLDEEMKQLRDELASVKTAAHDEKLALVNENKQLRTQVGRLRKRVEGLEKILKVEVKLTPEMQRLIDELPDDSTEAEE